MAPTLQTRLKELLAEAQNLVTDCDELADMTLPDQQRLKVIEDELSQIEEGLRPNYKSLKEKMGKRFIGPEAYKDLFGHEVEAGPLPLDLTFELLERVCPLTKDGETKVFQSHVLIWIPEKLNDQELSVNVLAEMANDYTESHELKYAVWKDNLGASYRQEEVYMSSKPGHWALVPLVLLPGSKSSTFDAQDETLRKFQQQANCNQYETAEARDLAFALVMTQLLTGEEHIANYYGICAEDCSGGRAALNNSGSLGLVVNYWVDLSDSSAGRAVFWKFLKLR